MYFKTVHYASVERAVELHYLAPRAARESRDSSDECFGAARSSSRITGQGSLPRQHSSGAFGQQNSGGFVPQLSRKSRPSVGQESLIHTLQPFSMSDSKFTR